MKGRLGPHLLGIAILLLRRKIKIGLYYGFWNKVFVLIEEKR
jgi:hypothetical protein